MTVVFEILSPSNTWKEMTHKLGFYSEYGAEEFYIYDPDTNDLTVYIRGKAILRRVYEVDGFVSPRMGIRFDLSGPELVLCHADGRPFLPFEELEAERVKAVQQANLAKQQVDLAVERTKEAEQQFRRLVELVQKQSTQQATPDELAELQRLLQKPPPGAE